MSYDIRIAVKVDGTDIFAQIAEPEYASPTYNLRDMFVACMAWDYKQGEYYPCSEAITKVERGIRELRTNKSAYIKYNPSNGWGSISSALKALECLRVCIYEQSEEIPIEHLWMAW